MIPSLSHLVTNCLSVAALCRLEQLSKHSNSRSTDNVQLIENLRTHAQTLDKSLQMEKERNRSLQ